MKTGFSAYDLQRVAAMLTKQFGVQVIVRGSECKTDGRTIYLPSIPPELGNERIISLIRYFLDHECGHLVGKTNMNVLTKFTGEVDMNFILNTLEDIRVESIMSIALAGCGMNLRSGASIVGDTLAEKARSGDQATLHPLKQFATCIYQVGRGLPIPDWIDKRVQQVLGPFLMKARSIPNWAQQTEDLEAFSRQLTDAYRKLTSPPPDAPSQQQGDQSQAGGNGDCQQPGNGQAPQQQQQQPPQEPQPNETGEADTGEAGQAGPENPPEPPAPEKEEEADATQRPDSGSDAGGDDGSPQPDEPPPASNADDINDAIDKSKSEPPPTGGDGADDKGDGDAASNDAGSAEGGDDSPDTDQQDSGDATGDEDTADEEGDDEGDVEPSGSSGESGDGDAGDGDSGSPDDGDGDGSDAGGDGTGDEAGASPSAGEPESLGTGDANPEGGGSGVPDSRSSTDGAEGHGAGGSDGVEPMLAEDPRTIDFKNIADEAATQIEEDINEAMKEVLMKGGDEAFQTVNPGSEGDTTWEDVKPYGKRDEKTDEKRENMMLAPDGVTWTKPPDVHEFLDWCRRTGGPMRQKLAQLLMAEARTHWHTGLKRGSPDPRKLAALVSGTSNRVMRKFVEEQAPDTACSLLIDLSSSMNMAARWMAAGLAAAAFGQVMDSGGHASTIIGFRTGGNGFHDGYGATLKGCLILRGKKWGESFRVAAPKIRKLVGSTGGCTPMCSAIVAAARDLMTRREKRKVLMVFTDGDPDDEVSLSSLAYQFNTRMPRVGNGSDTQRYIGYLCRRLEKMGVEVVLIGIQSDAVTRMHSKAVVVNDLKDLSTTVMLQLTKALHAGVHI